MDMLRIVLKDMRATLIELAIIIQYTTHQILELKCS